jgi:hypothetical protein
VIAHHEACGLFFNGPRRREAAGYSITSSARPRSDNETVIPSALAVLRLVISSTFVDC